MYEPWLQEQQKQQSYDRWLRSRPVCTDCGEHITEEWAYRMENGVICTKCGMHRLVEVELL